MVTVLLHVMVNSVGRYGSTVELAALGPARIVVSFIQVCAAVAGERMFTAVPPFC